MPLSVSLVVLKNKCIPEFTSSEEYKRIKDDLIFHKIQDDDGLVILFKCNRTIDAGICSTINESDYLFIDVDDEDEINIVGDWYEVPDYISVTNQMSILIKCNSTDDMDKNMDYYDTSVFKKLQDNEVQNLSDLLIKYGDWEEIPDSSDCEGLEKQKIERFEKVYNDTGYDNIGDFTHKWSLFELGFDTSESDDEIFVVTFEPTLRNIIKWKDVIEDELQEISDEEDENDYAWSVFNTANHELIESVGKSWINYPSIYCDKYVGHPDFEDGWEEC